MTKQKKQTLMMVIGSCILILSFLAYKIIHFNYLMCMNLIMVYVVAFLLFNIKNRENDIEVNKNNVAFLYGMLIQFAAMAGSIMENFYEGIRDIVFYWFFGIVLASFILNNSIIIKNASSKIYRYISAITCLIIYFMIAATMETFWGLFVGIPILVSYTVYEDKKLRIFLCATITIINFIGVIRHVTTFFTGNTYTIWIYLLEIFAMFIFTMSFSRTSKIIGRLNEESLKEINEKKDRTEKLSNDVTYISKKIKNSADETTRIINEIDVATDKSLKIFSDIGNDNINNANSVEQQSKMTGAIVDMINDVFESTNNANDATQIASNTLIKNKDSFIGIKKMSNNIVDYNEKVVKVINKFVISVNKVKDIINGITDISEQIDLLALNASIESARAGDVGKDFSVVAIEIKSLSEETTQLTNEINKVIDMLGKNASRVQKVVSEVVDEIKEENVTIDNTEKEFTIIEDNIKILNRYILEIIDRVKNVVEFSNNIEGHINQLAATSEEVTACTEEAVLLNKNNKAKVSQTCEMMKEMLDTVSEFNRYIVN